VCGKEYRNCRHIPAFLFKVTNPFADFFIGIPDHDIGEASRLDVQTATRPSHIISSRCRRINRICSPYNIDLLALFGYFDAALDLVLVFQACEWCDCDFGRRRRDIVVEKRLMLDYGARDSGVGDLKFRSQFMVRYGDRVLQVEGLRPLMCNVGTWVELCPQAGPLKREFLVRWLLAPVGE
jgi:hypothetical protein